MPLSPANQAQLIRSSQKDEYYRTFLKNRANEAFQSAAGSKRWLDWRREVELLSDLSYFALTTLSGFQTLGEEYVNIVQVDPTGRQIPSRVRRGLFVLLHTFLPYLLEKVLVCVENELEGEPERGGGVRRQAAAGGWSLERWLRRQVQKAVGLLTEPQRRACQPAVFVVQQGVALLHRLHVALFYLRSSFYHLSKRTTGIRYLRVMGPSGGDDSSIRRSYLLLGVFSVLQLLVSVVLQLHSFRQRQRARQEWRVYRKLSPQHSVSSNPRAARCILCLELRRNSTCTPCGHLFCWECITEWCNTKAECPLCREKFQPQRLVFLRNYS